MGSDTHRPSMLLKEFPSADSHSLSWTSSAFKKINKNQRFFLVGKTVAANLSPRCHLGVEVATCFQEKGHLVFTFNLILSSPNFVQLCLKPWEVRPNGNLYGPFPAYE